MPNTVSFKIQIEGSNELKTVTVSADALGQAFNAVRSSARTLNDEMVNLGAVSQVLEGDSSALSQLNGIMVGLTSAYSAQIEAETKLATAMRNTMDASEEEIGRIKQLTSEQQRLGIVGDEVQLAAAQELATYLGLSSSLETIIPTMNDMIAQQLGMGASAESATQIATMLGKVMNGQTKALSRYGYEFSEAQEYILKFGDESERAAVLCQVVGESVGGMNEALAQTDVGRQQQLSNTLGDIRETLGGLVQRAQPAVTTLTQIGQAATGIIQLKNAIDSVTKIQAVATASSKLYAAAQQLLARAGYAAAAGTTAMNVAVTALYATLTMGLTLAVQGLVALFTRLGSKGKEVADSINDAKDAQQAFADTSMNIRLELAEETIKLEALIKAKQDGSKAVADLNTKYGEIFGSHKTASEWYDVLTQKSQVYAKQIGYEAQAKVIASQKAAKELEMEALKAQRKDLEIKLAPENFRDNYGISIGATAKRRADEKALAALDQQINVLDIDTKKLGADFDTCTENMAAAAKELGIFNSGGGGGKNPKGKTPAEQLAEDVDSYRKSVERAVQVNQTFGGTVKDVDIQLKAMQSGLTSLITRHGAESASVQKLIKEYSALRRSREASIPSLERIGPVKTSYQSQEKDTRGNFKTISAIPTVAVPAISSRPGYQPTEYDLAFRKYNEIKAQIPGADPSQLKNLQQQLATLRELYDIPEEKADSLSGSVDAFGALSDAMGSLSGIVDEGAASWLSWGANVLKAIGQALPALTTLFAAQTAVAGAEGAASVASIPYVGPIMAVAAVASIAAAIASLPKFAAGGLIYGPTIGLMGEYANARTNPEFVGKVSDIQKYIQPSGGRSRIVGKLSGRDIILLEQRMGRFDARNNG